MKNAATRLHLSLFPLKGKAFFSAANKLKASQNPEPPRKKAPPIHRGSFREVGHLAVDLFHLITRFGDGGGKGVKGGGGGDGRGLFFQGDRDGLYALDGVEGFGDVGDTARTHHTLDVDGIGRGFFLSK